MPVFTATASSFVFAAPRDLFPFPVSCADDDAGRVCACDVAISIALNGSRRVIFVLEVVTTVVLMSEM